MNRSDFGTGNMNRKTKIINKKIGKVCGDNQIKKIKRRPVAR